MNKLTAGIFAGILTIVTVNAARADIATTNYVKGAIGSLDSTVAAENGAIDTITQTDGKITATRKLLKDADISGDAAIATSKISGLDTELAAKQTTGNMIKKKTDITEANKESETNYPSMAVAQQIADQAAAGVYADATSDMAEMQKSIDGLKDTVDQNKGAAEAAATNALTEAKAYTDAREGAITTAYTGAINAAKAEIKTTTDDLDGRVTANTNSITTLNGAETVEGSVDYKIKQKIDAVNSAASTLAGRVSANETAIQTLNGTGEGSVKKALADAKEYTNTAKTEAISTANQNTAGLLGDGVTTTNTVTKQFETTNANVTANAKAINDITKTGGTIDSKITAAQNTLQGNIDGKVDVQTDLANKLLTTDAASGQLVSATAKVAKPEKCTAQGAQCMLIDKGTGLEWELIVDTYAAN